MNSAYNVSNGADSINNFQAAGIHKVPIRANNPNTRSPPQSQMHNTNGKMSVNNNSGSSTRKPSIPSAARGGGGSSGGKASSSSGNTSGTASNNHNIDDNNINNRITTGSRSRQLSQQRKAWKDEGPLYVDSNGNEERPPNNQPLLLGGVVPSSTATAKTATTREDRFLADTLAELGIHDRYSSIDDAHSAIINSSGVAVSVPAPTSDYYSNNTAYGNYPVTTGSSSGSYRDHLDYGEEAAELAEEEEEEEEEEEMAHDAHSDPLAGANYNYRERVSPPPPTISSESRGRVPVPSSSSRNSYSSSSAADVASPYELPLHSPPLPPSYTEAPTAVPFSLLDLAEPDEYD
mmetsp:Transcript_4078/g.6466  ORF Transcript_4078/g.6466 Transcript_4078/m.6466 type:complete len:348 (+) Transcript_4078:341-1384(+)